MVGDEISCLKNVGLIQLSNATSHCQSLDASQILPRNRQESDDLVSALLSMNLSSDSGKTFVSIGIHKTKGIWNDIVGQPISYFNWLPDQLDSIYENLKYAGFRINATNESVGWAKFNGTNELNVVCTKRVGQGKRF